MCLCTVPYFSDVTKLLHNIDRSSISAPGHGKEVIYGLHAVYKRYIYQLMSKVQLPGSVIFDSQIKIHTGTENKDVSLAREFKDHLEG